MKKTEWINSFQIMDYKYAYEIIFEYINTFYNTVRIHNHCRYKAQQKYEKEYLDKLETNIRKVLKL